MNLKQYITHSLLLSILTISMISANPSYDYDNEENEALSIKQKIAIVCGLVATAGTVVYCYKNGFQLPFSKKNVTKANEISTAEISTAIDNAATSVDTTKAVLPIITGDDHVNRYYTSNNRARELYYNADKIKKDILFKSSLTWQDLEEYQQKIDAIATELNSLKDENTTIKEQLGQFSNDLSKINYNKLNTDVTTEAKNYRNGIEKLFKNHKEAFDTFINTKKNFSRPYSFVDQMVSLPSFATGGIGLIVGGILVFVFKTN